MLSSSWINENFYILKRKLSNIKTNDWDDIFQEVLIQFLTMDEKKSSRLIKDGVAMKYIMGMFKINVYSPTSPYRWRYNRMVYDKDFNLDKYEREDVDEYEDQLCLADIEMALDMVDEHFVYKLVFEDYLKRKTQTPGYSMKKISNESDITKPTLIVKFGELKQQVKKIIDEI